jgi:hypothetical protein
MNSVETAVRSMVIVTMRREEAGVKDFDRVTTIPPWWAARPAFAVCTALATKDLNQRAHCQRAQWEMAQWEMAQWEMAQREMAHWEMAGAGYGIHWPELDEDLNTEGLLAGARAPRGSAGWRPSPAR